MYCAYLDAYRAQLGDTVAAMEPGAACSSRLASGWTPLGLAVHLTHVERRWIVWGFLGEDVGDPWPDRAEDSTFVAPPSSRRDEVLQQLAAQGRVTSGVLLDHDLAEHGQPSERWAGDDPPTLERIALHLVQEYARHLGHLDIVTELADGDAGTTSGAGRPPR